jgi:hypothetical protein
MEITQTAPNIAAINAKHPLTTHRNQNLLRAFAPLREAFLFNAPGPKANLETRRQTC